MAGRVLIGVDVGTSSVKGAAFDAAGQCLAVAQQTSGYDAPAPGWAEADADAWWVATRDVLRQLVAAVGRDAVAAVGVTGQAPTLLAVDAGGHPLGPAILWLDVRSEREARDLSARLGHDAERIGGNRIHAYYLGPKLEWMRRYAPARFAATATVLQSHSYPTTKGGPQCCQEPQCCEVSSRYCSAPPWPRG